MGNPAENSQHAVVAGLRDCQVTKRGRPVVQIDPASGAVLAEHGSIQAAVGLSDTGSTIQMAVDRPNRTAGGYQWRTRPDPAPPDEEWRRLLEYQGIRLHYLRYEVSSAGRVRRENSGHAMALRTNPGGYRTIKLCTASRQYQTVAVHRLVASVFQPRADTAALDVDHIDGDPGNNRADNLRWLSRADHAAKTLGKAVWKLDRDTGDRLSLYGTSAAAAFAAGASPSSVYKALTGRTKTCMGFRWEYAQDGDRIAAERGGQGEENAPISDTDLEELLGFALS